MRSGQTNEIRKIKNKEALERMRAHRAMKTDEEKSYERMTAKIRMRNLRKEKSKGDIL